MWYFIYTDWWNLWGFFSCDWFAEIVSFFPYVWWMNLTDFPVGRSVNFITFSHKQLVDFQIFPMTYCWNLRVFFFFHAINGRIKRFFPPGIKEFCDPPAPRLIDKFCDTSPQQNDKIYIYFLRSMCVFREFSPPATRKWNESKRCIKNGSKVHWLHTLVKKRCWAHKLLKKGCWVLRPAKLT